MDCFRVLENGDVRRITENELIEIARGEVRCSVDTAEEARDIICESHSPAAEEICFSTEEAAGIAWATRKGLAYRTLSPEAEKVIDQLDCFAHDEDMSTLSDLQALEDGAALAEMGFGDSDTEAVNEAYEFLERWRKVDC